MNGKAGMKKAETCTGGVEQIAPEVYNTNKIREKVRRFNIMPAAKKTTTAVKKPAVAKT